LKNRHDVENKSINKFLTINGIFLFGTSFLPNIAWYAHLGGFTIGLIYYYIVKKDLDYDLLNYEILKKTV
jgi:membrane associated rhomboid family serine protease